MNFNRIKRSNIPIKWMRDHPILARIYAFTALFWAPFAVVILTLWENRENFVDVYEDILGVIFMEDDIDGKKIQRPD